jgi:hypothetical protein
MVAIFVRSARPIFRMISALIIFIGAPTFFYAVIVMEVRYLIFATAPLLLILALFVRSIATGFSEVLRRNKPAVDATDVSGVAT